MIERNVGSAALIGGNAKLGGSAWGVEKTDGTVLFDGTVTLDEWGQGGIELKGELIPDAEVIVTIDGTEYTGTVDYTGEECAVEIADVIYISSEGYVSVSLEGDSISLIISQSPAPPYIESSPTITVNSGSSGMLNVSLIPLAATLTATIANESIAAASVSGGVVTVTAVSEGVTTMTLAATYNGLSSVKEVAVTVSGK